MVPIRVQTKVELIGLGAWPKLADWLVRQSNVRFLGLLCVYLGGYFIGQEVKTKNGPELIAAFKVSTGLQDVSPSKFFLQHTGPGSKGHPYYTQYCRKWIGLYDDGR